MGSLIDGNLLPDVVIQNIFKYLRLGDIQTASLVCKLWGNNGKATIRRLQKRFGYEKRFLWQRVTLPSESRHPTEDRVDSSLCFSPSTNCIYLFGGVNLKREAAFNDMLRFDMDRLSWSRVIVTRGQLPRPKGQATFTRWTQNCMVLFGGAGPETFMQAPASFFSEVHLFFEDELMWIKMETVNDGPHLSEHTAAIDGDHLIVFGGRLAERIPNHEVHVLDLTHGIWKMPRISEGLVPDGRYGATLVPIKPGRLLLVNGTPFLKHSRPEVDELAASDWILSFDPKKMETPWKWIRKTVIGRNCGDADDRFMRNSCSAVAWWRADGRLRLASLGVSPKPLTSRDHRLMREYKNIEEEMRKLFNEVKTILERRFRERIDKLKKIRGLQQEMDDEMRNGDLSLSLNGINFHFINVWNKAIEKEILEAHRGQDGRTSSYEENGSRSKTEPRSSQISISATRISNSFRLIEETDLADVIRALRHYINTLQCHYYARGPEPQLSSRSLLRRAGLPRLSLFLADATQILDQDLLKWEPQPIEMRASPFCNRFSFLATKGELLLHGGVTENEQCAGSTYMLIPEREI